MPGAPVALDKAPRASHVDSVPRVPEPVVFEADARLVTGRLAVAFDDHTMETGVTER